MILTQLQNVSRSFDANVLLEKSNMVIQDTSKIALVGPNGAGKSTLLKMIVGELLPDDGEITKKKGLTLGYLSQNSNLDSELTIYDEMVKVFQYLKDMEQQLHRYENQIANFQGDFASKEYEQLVGKHCCI